MIKTNTKTIYSHKAMTKDNVKTMRISLAIKTLIMAIIIAVGAYAYTTYSSMSNYVSDMNKSVDQLQKQISSLKQYQNLYYEQLDKNNEIIDKNKKLEKKIEQVTKEHSSISQQMDNVKQKSAAVTKENSKLKKDLGLYDEYKYAFYEDGHRTDLTIDQLKLGIKLMKAKGYNPHILFGIGMVESGYNKNCTSTISTAKGYHQFLDGTAKFTYETLLKHGKGAWTPSKSLDPETNIRMCVAYFDYLYKKHGNFYKAMGQYCGAGTSPGSFTYTYIKRMNKYVSKSNVNIYSIIDKM